MLVQPGDGAYHLRDVNRPGERPAHGYLAPELVRQPQPDHFRQADRRRAGRVGGVAVGRFYRDFRLRYAHRWEIHHLLTSAGYEVVDLYGDFNRSPFDEESEEMVWTARPREG